MMFAFLELGVGLVETFSCLCEALRSFLEIRRLGVTLLWLLESFIGVVGLVEAFRSLRVILRLLVTLVSESEESRSGLTDPFGRSFLRLVTTCVSASEESLSGLREANRSFLEIRSRGEDCSAGDCGDRTA